MNQANRDQPDPQDQGPARKDRLDKQEQWRQAPGATEQPNPEQQEGAGSPQSQTSSGAVRGSEKKEAAGTPQRGAAPGSNKR